MAIATRIVTGLLSVALLVFAGLLVGVMLVPKVEHSPSALFCAGFAVLLALAINPLMGRRNGFVIAGVIVVGVVTVLCVRNYDYWSQRHRFAMARGLRDQVENMSIDTRGVYTGIWIDGPPPTLFSPFRQITSAEVADNSVFRDESFAPRNRLGLVKRASDATQLNLHIQIYGLVGIRRALHAPVDEFANHDFDVAKKYLSGGKIVLTSGQTQITGVICPGDLDNLQGTTNGEVPFAYQSNDFGDDCSDREDHVADQSGGSADKGVADFVTAMTKTASVRLDMYGSGGQLVATTLYPTTALSEALQHEARMIEKIRKGDVYEPFSPFHNYAP